jgi:hypothetical protein
VGGTGYSSLEIFSEAEIAVLHALALAAKVGQTARLSNETRANPAQPWRITVHSRTARRLEDRKKPALRISINSNAGDGGYYLDGMDVELTPHGQEALKALENRRLKPA